MNVDFALPATGANARRLLLIASSSNIKMADKIHEIAKEGLIPQSKVNSLTNIERVALQFILDCELRCALPSVDFPIDPSLVLNAVSLAGVTKLTVVPLPASRTDWKVALDENQSFTDLKVLTPAEILLHENQEGRRDGVLIHQWDGTQLVNSAIACEFPRTILWQSRQRHDTLNLPYMGSSLFPTALADSYKTGWTNRSQRQLAPFLNVFLPEYASMPGYLIED